MKPKLVKHIIRITGESQKTAPSTHPCFIENKAYTLSDMAALYKVSRYTFQCWIRPFLKELGDMRRTLTPKQVRIIFEKLDYPLDFE